MTNLDDPSMMDVAYRTAKRRTVSPVSCVCLTPAKGTLTIRWVDHVEFLNAGSEATALVIRVITGPIRDPTSRRELWSTLPQGLRSH